MDSVLRVVQTKQDRVLGKKNTAERKNMPFSSLPVTLA